MRKLILTAAAIAVVAGLASAAYVSGMFQKDISVSFNSTAVDMPKILLVPSAAGECQRRRVLDDFGGATDNVDLVDGKTRVVVFKRLPIIHSETTYYPVSDRKDCESFSKDGPLTEGRHGQLFTSIERDDTGRKPVRERTYSPDGKLVSAGNLVENGGKFQTDTISLAGLITRSETYNLTSNSIESETLYRPDGTALVRQALKPTETSFTKEHFSADGKVVVMKESRSYGNYNMSKMYPDGKPQFEAYRGIDYTNLKFFRTDGTAELQVQLWSFRSITFNHFNAAGMPDHETRWTESKSGTVDSNGYKPLVLTKLIETNEQGKPIREVDLRADGTVEKATVFKNGEYYHNRVEYVVNPQGQAISYKARDNEGNLGPEVILTPGTGPTFTVPDAYRVLTPFSVPAGLDRYDDKIVKEIPYHPGM